MRVARIERFGTRRQNRCEECGEQKSQSTITRHLTLPVGVQSQSSAGTPTESIGRAVAASSSGPVGLWLAVPGLAVLETDRGRRRSQAASVRSDLACSNHRPH